MGIFWSDRASSQFIQVAFGTTTTKKTNGEDAGAATTTTTTTNGDAGAVHDGSSSEHHPHGGTTATSANDADDDPHPGAPCAAYPEVAALETTMAEIRGYNEAQEARNAAIRAAMAAPDNDAALVAALRTLKSRVSRVGAWHDLAEQLASLLPRLLVAFEAELAEKRFAAATRALSRILAFVVAFDSAKIATPGIQNDFSFVKRAASKAPRAAAEVVDATKASAVSLFIAQPSPMLARLALAVDGDAGCRVLGTIASLCASTAADHAPKRLADRAGGAHDAIDACLRVMTSAFVLYDRAARTPGGAFGSGSRVSARKVASALRKRGAGRDGFESLLAALRYTTLHYASHASPAVQAIVER